MKPSGISKKSLLALLLTLSLASGFLHFSGCIAIPEAAFVVSGSDDLVLQRQANTCDSGADLARLHETGIDPAGFSVLSWNSHKGTDDNWLGDLALYAAGVDFVLLQEAALDEGLRSGLKGLSREWLMAPAFQSREKEFGILSAGNIAAVSSCALREAEPLLLIPKMILAATYPLTGRTDELLLVNVHMVNFTIGSEVVRRQLTAAADLIRKHQGPVVVAGDFNVWSEERELAVSGIMHDLGLQPVSFEPDNRSQFLTRRVDDVYYRGLEVTNSACHLVTSSDHNPLEVHFRVAQEGPS